MNLKNQNIEFFELYVRDQLLVEGEEIYDTYIGFPLNLIDKGLWVAQFTPLEIEEVEIVVTKSKIINYNCPCDNFDQKGICGHVVATLFALRSKLQKKQPSTNPVSSKSFKKTNLSVQQILEKVSSNDLHRFLRSYATKDKRFNLLIKAHFAREILGSSSIDEYKGIAESLLKPISQKDQKITPASIRILQSVGDEFLAQFEDALSMDRNNEAFYLLFSLLPKIAYAKHFITKDNITLNRMWKQSHKSLERLLNNDLAPELKRDIIYESLDLIQKSYYQVYDFKENVIEIIYQNEVESNVISDLNEIIERKVGKHFYETPNHFYYTAFLVRNQKDMDQIFDNVEIKHRIKIAETLISLSAFTSAQKLLESCIEESINPHYKRAVRSKLLHLYKKQDLKDEYFDLSISIVLDKYQESNFKEIITDPKYNTILLQRIENLEDTEYKHQLMTKYYAESNNDAELIHYLLTHGSLSLMKKYDQKLYPIYPRKVEQRYATLIKLELDNLLGFKASRIVQDLGNYWATVSLIPLKKYIWTMLRDEYSHRTQLLSSI